MTTPWTRKPRSGLHPSIHQNLPAQHGNKRCLSTGHPSIGEDPDSASLDLFSNFHILIQNEPFSNPQLAMYYDQQFTSVLDRNFAYNVRGQQRAAKRSKARFL